MEKILIIIFFCVSCTAGYSQNWDEWFNQKKTQKKYLIQQIAGLQIYIEFLQKGYSIAKGGLNLIGDLKNGEFALHKNYFNSLKNVNPVVSKYARVAEIIALQKKVVEIYNKVYKQALESDAFNTGEINYIYDVYSRLLTDCATTLDELINVTTNDKLEMKDGERLNRIDILYLNMIDQYTFAKSFGNETMVLAVSRKKEKNDIETSRKLNGLK